MKGRGRFVTRDIQHPLAASWSVQRLRRGALGHLLGQSPTYFVQGRIHLVRQSQSKVWGSEGLRNLFMAYIQPTGNRYHGCRMTQIAPRRPLLSISRMVDNEFK